MSAKALERLRELEERERISAQERDASARDATSPKITTSTEGRDAELQGMLEEFDLLSEARRVTGEQGRESGDYVAFDRCPVCGHRDCFRVYPITHSWACYGASNTTGITGGSVLDLWQATGRASSAAEAVRRLREATGRAYQPDRGEALNWGDEDSKDESATEGDPLPMWEPCRSHDPRKEPPALIGDVLRRRAIGIIAAKGKASKTWLMLRLGIETTMGGTFLGHRLERGRVLFVDAEMGAAAIDNRVAKICDALGYDRREVDSNLIVWSVEGFLVRDRDGEHAPTIDDLLAQIEKRGETFDLVIVDSCSNFLQCGADENSNADISTFYGKLRRITSVTGAAMWISHHFGKGAQGERDGADMLRGASSWLDRPSVAFVMREVFPPSGEPSDFLGKGERAFVIECAGMRSFEWPDEQHVIWSFPTHRVDSDNVTDGWKPKTKQGDGGRASTKTREAQAEAQAMKAQAAILAHMYHEGISDPEGLTTVQAAEVASKALGKPVQTKQVKLWLEGSPWLTVWQKSKRKHYVCPMLLAPRVDAEEGTEADTSTLDALDCDE